MTVLVGVKCTDGVIIGADSAATSAAGNQHLLKTDTDKISIIDGQVILAGTGAMGLGQRFQAIVADAVSQNILAQPCIRFSCALATAGLNDFRQTGAGAGQYGALFAAYADNGPQLIEFAATDFQPEMKTAKTNFVAMGSGQTLAEPFMAFVSRVLWKGTTPDVKTALFGVWWALNHTLTCAPGFVGPPISIAVLEDVGGWKSRLISSEELGEQSEHIKEIEHRIASYSLDLLAGETAAAVPKF